MKSKKKIIGFSVMAVLVFLMIAKLMANHTKIEESKNEESEFSTTVSVDVALVNKQETENKLSLVGTLDSNTELNIAAETQGKITKLNAELGQYITKGTVIAIIDNKLKELAVETAKLNYGNTEKDLARYENLAKGGSVSQQQIDDIRMKFKNTKIQLEQAEKQLADATIIAPISGYLVEKNVEVGTFVNMGTSIATIIDISKLKVKLNVSESNVYGLKVGDQAKITTDVFPEASFTGLISFISAKGDDAHNYPVEVELANNGKYKLKSGTFVNVQIKTSSTNRELVIPRESLQGSTQDAKVYVCENGKANLRKIVLGGGSNNYLVVLSGLCEGETVVVSGQVNLADGRDIRIIKTN